MIKSIRGTKDQLPVDIYKWQFLESVFKKVSDKFAYKELRTPTLEKTEVFSRGIGDGTDIVNKEMYTFEDRGGDSVTLRPEMTAALVRSVIQNSLQAASSVNRLWYFGPFFRYERPQKGRLRQFHQYGAECIGSDFPESDAEIITLACDLIKNTGINTYKLLINTLGNEESRKEYREALITYLNIHKEKLSADSVSRLDINPLRVLDSKNPNDIEIVADAPIILDYLDSESKEHFERVKELLDSSNIEYEITPKLVRGLDYYSHTVFEFQNSSLGAQNSFGGGGRYNKLFQELGGKPTPAVGFAFGVERILLILEENNLLPEPENTVDAYVVISNKDYLEYANKAVAELRNKGLKVAQDLLRRSMKAQFREANKMSAKYTIVIGDDEIKEQAISIKDMAKSEQIKVQLSELSAYNFSI